ncbi:MAG: hypothetical protein AAF688_05935 [Bacteroidota bacterium]
MQVPHKKGLYFTVVVMLVFNMPSFAQLFHQQLEEVIIINSQTETVRANSFSQLNKYLAISPEINFSKEIKRAKSKEEVLVFQSDKNLLVLKKSTYLKLIRRAGNRNEDVYTFYLFLIEELPELQIQFKKDDYFEEFYTNVRSHTFYGKLETLPEVL